jgi:ribosomal protein S18 acetylase RimI-like enzyme
MPSPLPIPDIRPLAAGDRPRIAEILERVGNFNPAEVECALELVDSCLRDPNHPDYRILVAVSTSSGVCGYACWGPTPLTRGTYDLYWIAADPAVQGQGVGRALMSQVEASVRALGGRLLVAETSSKDSYAGTVSFYRRLGYEEASRVRDFYDTGDDRLVFVKRLSP